MASDVHEKASDVHEIGKKVTFMKESLYERQKWTWLVSNKTNALSSLRTAQAGKSETRQNEKTYYRIQKVLSVSGQIQWSKLMWIL